MIPQTHVAQKSIVLDNVGSELNNGRFVLIVSIAFNEAFVELDRLTERKVLAGSFVQSTTSLDDLGRTAESDVANRDGVDISYQMIG